MHLVSLNEALKKIGVSKPHYYYLARKGLLPSWSKRETVPGRRGCIYLYDEDEFIRAWNILNGLKRNRIGVDRSRLANRVNIINKLPQQECIRRLLYSFPAKDGESLEEYDKRYKETEAELWKVPVEELRRRVLEMELEASKAEPPGTSGQACP